ncbi:SusC/RagA family TonB-linked outer membrane protein [Gramella sp. KN1008]|uniref:SusC/RagA family TonB-linked outer membrane protein n=1 Tax=Gramella sp. KN1008 TaxID=2529298 RepID=UPI0010401179|nr:SusC/RagA family TonB-linked outer membrane protein [Gramella sp. KN1008]TBW25875.1 SusC/RagA family TonB-linked outer membrane protein [Gramella sp. KN1008]
MRSNYKILCLMVFLLSGISLFAQQRTISGTVTDAEGVPLPGVNIIVDGTGRGTQTNFDGNYTIEANVGETLTYSFVGFDTTKITIGADTSDQVNVTLAGASELEEVVITAQGIRREKKALGYAVSTVDAEEIERKPQQDIARSLAGKVPGVQITGTGGATGSGTNFIIRSKSSITGDNQPLFIVDGVPFNGANNAQGSFVDGGNNTSSRFLDLDPNNIESVSVLKGLSASVLYGQQGRNGVVLITTKSGSAGDVNKKFEVSVSNTTYLTQIMNLPEYQNEYGQGADQTPNRGFVGNWGARFDEDLMIDHPYYTSVLAEAFPEFQGVQIPYRAVPDNVSSFFRDGIGISNFVNISGANGDTNLNLSVGHTDEEGFIPENHLRRLNLGLGGSAKLSNNFTVSGSFNFADTKVKTPPIAAGNGVGAVSIFTRLLFIPRNLDLANLPYTNPLDNSSVYYRTDQDNPYWLLENAGDRQSSRRFFGNMSAVYDFNNHIQATYRYGLDTYTENNMSFVNKGSLTTDLLGRGYLRETNAVNTINDHNVSLAFNNYDLTDDLVFNARVGFNARRDDYVRRGTASTDQVVFGVLNERNYINQSQIDPVINEFLSFRNYQNVFGAYAQVEMDYQDYLYLTLSGRNDWGSTVEKEYQSLFYPGASISFIPTSAFNGFGGESVNYLKLRGAFGTSAGYPTPFNTRAQLSAIPTAFVDRDGEVIPTNEIDNFRANPDLKPELHKEIELGLESKLLSNRVGLDLTVYRRISEDQIITSSLPPGTGFSSTIINAGRIDTEGFEASLNLQLIDGEDFQWNLNNNFNAYETTVIDIPEDEIYIAGFGTIANLAIEGEPLGVIKGDYAVKDDQGRFLIDPNTGKIIPSGSVGLEPKIVGDPNPDWNLTTINSITWKNLNLSAQLEYQHGGDIYSLSTNNLIRRGVVSITDRERPHVIPGVLGNPETGEVLTDDDGNAIPNDIQISANDLYFINFLDTNEGTIYDASNIRLRDITLSYQLPSKLLTKTPFGSVSFALNGQNLYVKAFNFPDEINYDPEVLSTGVGNGMGLEFGTAPTSRRYSFSIKATF